MELKQILEAILFSAQKPLAAKDLRQILVDTAEQSEEEGPKPFRKTRVKDVDAALEELKAHHAGAGRSYQLACVAGSWQFVSDPEFAPWLKVLVGEKPRPARLSQPGLETLAIIAYRQPLTRAEMEQIRGVNVDGVVSTLLERGLVEKTGTADLPGRPALYGTTSAFLEYFGLAGLEELPAADELRRIVIERPEGLATVDAGLETAEAADESATDNAQEAQPAPPGEGTVDEAGDPDGAADTPVPPEKDSGS